MSRHAPFGESGSDGTIEVDLWELNHVQCAITGDVTLDQVIVWRFRPWGIGTLGVTPDYYVVQWGPLKDTTPVEKHRGRWIGQIRGKTYSAKMFIESWTTVDYELLDRKRLPDDLR